MVVTPDRDVETSTLAVGEVYQEVKRYELGRLPRGVRDKDTYLPRHSDQGDFSSEEMRRLVLIQEDLAANQDGGRRHRDGRVVRPDGIERARHDEVPESGTHLWLAVYRSGGGHGGDEVQPPGDALALVVNGKTFKLFSLGGEEILAQRVHSSEVGAMKGVFGLRGEEAKAEERDLRILPVVFDAAEERYRTIQECIPEYEEVDFDDFPLAGPRTMFHDSRQLRRMGLDFIMHHEAWLKKSGVRSTDRSVHEHSSLCRVLHLMMTYDQLNLPSLASAEALNRRRALIEYAHSGRPDAPSYEGAEEFLGVRDQADGSLVDPSLTQHAARRQAAKAEIMKQSRLAAEERKHARKGDGKGDKEKKGAKDGSSNP